MVKTHSHSPHLQRDNQAVEPQGSLSVLNVAGLRASVVQAFIRSEEDSSEVEQI